KDNVRILLIPHIDMRHQFAVKRLDQQSSTQHHRQSNGSLANVIDFVPRDHAADGHADETGQHYRIGKE
ncbi:hypothetical protein, partial [Enterococcus faecium]